MNLRMNWESCHVSGIDTGTLQDLCFCQAVLCTLHWLRNIIELRSAVELFARERFLIFMCNHCPTQLLVRKPEGIVDQLTLLKVRLRV